MKRVVLFLLTNLAVLVVMRTVLTALGVDHYLAQQGIDIPTLLVFSFVLGFAGALISLVLSKPMAKWSTGARTISGSEGDTERWLVQTVAELASRAGITTPEVAIYDGAPNAFATGAFKNNALVAVSTGLLSSMNAGEIEAVLGHEMTHVANGDMVTLTLIQGVLNTFVIFLSRIVGFIVDRVILRSDDERRVGIGYYMTVFACEILFGLLATMIVMWFSRYREYRADRGSADLLGSPRPMIEALERLGQMEAAELPTAFRSSGIHDRPGWLLLFSSHPSIGDRVTALQGYTPR